jgi:hypothetical protein
MRDFVTNKASQPSAQLPTQQIVTVALGLDVIAIASWLLGFFGPFPPHPWIFLLFAALALACEIVAIVIAIRNSNLGTPGVESRGAIVALLAAVLPLVVVALVYLVASSSLAISSRG